MQLKLVLAAGAAAVLSAGSALAEPSLAVTRAAARVTVIPEARSDVSVTVVKTNPRLPLHIRQEGDRVVVDGGLGARGFSLFDWSSGANCHGGSQDRWVTVSGVGRVNWQDLPQIVVRTPLDAHIGADGAVWGVVGRGHALDLSDSGCGDWTVANQAGDLKVHVAGSGDVYAGSSQAADVSVSGSGDVYLTRVNSGLTVSVAGSGDVTATSVDGPLHTKIAGSGDVRVHAGNVGEMRASVAGSGDVRFGGVARTLDAHIAGSGDVYAAKVTGEVTKHVAGSGEVSVGQ